MPCAANVVPILSEKLTQADGTIGSSSLCGVNCNVRSGYSGMSVSSLKYVYPPVLTSGVG